MQSIDKQTFRNKIFYHDSFVTNSAAAVAVLKLGRVGWLAAIDIYSYDTNSAHIL